ncbi:VOC family protein [Pelagicoccus sp. SDUM812002]|uniref:VOC family protein n=1 Tax=Pelagicoccus sp. SDUM812002 TaxID=3041266 RepID=UPI00280D7F23|nr:VOC family protein [Pelagicoccus sp. SDUM812002]MDQ8185065.1 VOC family protein [Pelagicoccus sp. SDUM812002]
MSEASLSISLTVKDGDKALDFYARAFGAKELYRLPSPDGGVAHAEFMLGDAKVFLSEESPEWHAYAMADGAKASCLFCVAAENCDEVFAQAKAAGGTGLSEPADMFWGARSAMILDPFGYRWSLSQVIEEVAPEEIERRAKAAFAEAK